MPEHHVLLVSVRPHVLVFNHPHVLVVSDHPHVLVPHQHIQVGTTFGVLRAPNDSTTPGGGPLLVSVGCQMGRPAQVGDHFWCP